MSLKYATIVPLIGGMTLAAKKITGEDPVALISYSPFSDNEKSLINYMPDVPYHLLDKGGSTDAGKGADFISALCPCAGLSQLGTGDQVARDKANFWMFETANHVLGHLKPKVFWGENAPAMFSGTNKNGENARSKLQEIAFKNGYTCSFYFTSTSLHGVPQRRHRTFYFFWQEKDRIPILPFWKRPQKTLAEYMAEIPSTASMHESEKDQAYEILRKTKFARYANHLLGADFPNHVRDRIRYYNRNVMTVQTFILDKELYPNALSEMTSWFTSDGDEKSASYMSRISKQFSEGRGIWDDSPSIFLPEGQFNALIGRALDASHPIENRSITTREAMHLMALPHDFELKTKNTNAICQNVPICTAADMQQGVLDYLNGKLPMVNGSVLFQDNFKEVIDERRSISNSPLLVF